MKCQDTQPTIKENGICQQFTCQGIILKLNGILTNQIIVIPSTMDYNNIAETGGVVSRDKELLFYNIYSPVDTNHGTFSRQIPTTTFVST